ncbi:hypothetical protein Tco_0742801 [Tanacetum coccineum]
MFGEWPLFRPVFAMVWMGEMACVLIYRELKYYASTFHNRCLFRDATICLTKLARGKYFSKIDLRLVSPASFMSLSLVILYLPDDIIIGSSRLKLSPMAGDLLGDGGEAFSGACWLYRRSGGFQYTSDASKERFWVVLLIANGNGPGDSICYVKLIDIFKIIRAQIYFYSAETKHETVKMVGTFIKEAQRDDGELWAIVQNVEDGKHTEFSDDDDSVVWFEDRLCVPNDQALREKDPKFYVLRLLERITEKLGELVLKFSTAFISKRWSELSKCTNEKVAVAKEKLKEARSRQKSYADKHRRDLEFQVGDRVFLKVSPFRGVKRFGIKGKLSPRFIGPVGFWIVLRGFVSSGASSAVIAHSRCLYRISFEGIPVYPLQVAFILLIRSVDMSLSEEPESIRDRKRERSEKKKKYKGKAILIEDESVQKKSKKQEQEERLNHEEAIRLQEQINEEERKRIARDAEIAKQLQEEYDKAGKKEAVTEVDTAHVIDWNDPSIIRYHALQNRPRSVAKTNIRKESVQEQTDKEPKTDELSQEQLNQMVIIVQDKGINVEALQTKYPIIGWEVYSEDTMQFWKIIRVGNYTEIYQVFEEMLKNFDRDDLDKLWSLVQERYNSS